VKFTSKTKQQACGFCWHAHAPEMASFGQTLAAGSGRELEPAHDIAFDSMTNPDTTRILRISTSTGKTENWFIYIVGDLHEYL